MVSQKKHTEKTIASWNKTRERGIKKYQENRRKKMIEKKVATTVRRVNPNRAILNAIYNILCKELKPQHTTCQCCHQNPATEIHHKKGRCGLLLIMSYYFAYICNECHRKATTNSAWAKEIGLSLLINSKTEYIFTSREVELMEGRGVHILLNYRII